MTGDYDDPPRAGRGPWLLLLLLIAFAGGMVAALYAVGHSTRIAGWLALVPARTVAAEQAVSAQRIAALSARAAAPAPVATTASAPDPAIETRLADLQGKIAAIETQARAATGDASRAEGLLVAFAARRALDRGLQLGYIEGLLRQRFGRAQPEAVATLLSAARQPVTLADLQTGLDAVAPALAAGTATTDRESWWTTVRRELAGMVVVRRAGQPSNQPADRVARAERLLEAGQVDGALAEVLRIADHSAAARWTVQARHYLAGRNALDRIETAALLDPGIVTPPPPVIVVPPPVTRAVPTLSLPAPAPAPAPAPTPSPTH